MSGKRIFNLAVLVVGVAALAGIVAEIGWDKVTEHLSAIGWWFAALIAINAAVIGLETAAWRVAIGPGVGIPRMVGAALAGAAINSLTPLGEGGEVVKANLVTGAVPGQRAVSSVMMWNLMFRLTKHLLIFVGPIALFFAGSAVFDLGQLGLFLLAALIATIPTVLYFLVLREGGAEWTIRILRRIPIVKRRITTRLLDKARTTDRLVHEFATERLRDAALMGLLLFCARVVNCLDVWVILELLGQEVSFVDSMFLVSGVFVVRVFLSISPVAIGVGEGGETALFAMLGLPADVGFAQAFVKLIRAVMFNLAGLAWLAWDTGFSKKPNPGENGEAT